MMPRIMNPTRTAIRRILKAQPNLTYHGFEGLRVDGFADRRAQLLSPDTLVQVEACIAYLGHIRKTVGVSRKAPQSYALKHRVEEWSGATGGVSYVSNGTFILAALVEGVPVEPTGLNANVGLFVRDVDALKSWTEALVVEKRKGMVVLHAGATSSTSQSSPWPSRPNRKQSLSVVVAFRTRDVSATIANVPLAFRTLTTL